jgi:hypothetical protein
MQIPDAALKHVWQERYRETHFICFYGWIDKLQPICRYEFAWERLYGS